MVPCRHSLPVRLARPGSRRSASPRFAPRPRPPLRQPPFCTVLVNVSIPRALTVAALLAATLAACADQPTDPQTPGPEPKPAPLPLGVYVVTITGADGSENGGAASSRAVAMPAGPSDALNPIASGITLEALSTTTFSEGTRSTGGQRFVVATFRVRNTSGAPLSNLTMIPITQVSPNQPTITGTPFTSLLRFDGTSVPAAASLAPQIVPSGAVSLGESGRLQGINPDVLQVFTEAEVAAIPLPANVTGIFPYGFVTRNASTPTSRTLPVAANANDFGGLVTFAFRYPMTPVAGGGAGADPFSIGFAYLAVQDSETRMTESIEERQDTASVRRLRERATALGATTVTVLAGSPAADPFVTDYPGQRQICSVRTAGTPASPTAFINRTGVYTELPIYRTGETTDPCAAYFTAGTAAPANYGMNYPVTVRAMDRYGNVKTTQVDTITLTSSDGTAVPSAPAALAGGAKGMGVVYTTYGNSTLFARGRRIQGSTPMFVNGMTRKWDGETDTHWLTNLNWDNNMHPGAQDSVIIPGDRTNYPLLVQNTAVPNVIMTDGATSQPFINLSSFDLTVSGDLVMGNNGTFQGTGRVILAGASNTIGGGLSNVNMRNLRITGRYSVTSNVNVTGGRIVVQGGRLRNEKQRIRVRPN